MKPEVTCATCARRIVRRRSGYWGLLLVPPHLDYRSGEACKGSEQPTAEALRSGGKLLERWRELRCVTD